MTFLAKTVMAVIEGALVFALGLVLLAIPAWGQPGHTAEPTSQRWFRVSWTPPTEGVGLQISRGRVFNDSPHRVTDVRLQVEGLDS